MARRSVDSAIDDVVARCYAGLDPTTLMRELVDHLDRILAIDAVFCATVDPATLLFTSAVFNEIPADAAPRFLANELLEDDVNKFTMLAAARSPVDWLDRVTGQDRGLSARFREIMAPIGLGDELRAAFRSGGHTWGFLCLHRENAPRGFTAAEARLVARLSSHVGEGLRRGLLVDFGETSAEPDGPGVLVVGDDGSLVATTPAGERWLWELSDPDHAVGPLPVAIEGVLARLEGIRSQRAPLDVQPRVRVRTRSGGWAVVHASEIAGLGGDRHVAVVVEAARPPELAPLLLLAYGLTKREGEVARFALQGKPNKVIARELRVSEHTIEDHLKAIFTKVGVGSRGQLAATIFAEQYSGRSSSSSRAAPSRLDG